MRTTSNADVRDMLTLLAQSQALLVANLALALSQGSGLPPETLASLMEGAGLEHRDSRVVALAEGMRRPVLDTLRASAAEAPQEQ